jgi:2-dehydro-3-deoxy-D-arabinonate dehydratase
LDLSVLPDGELMSVDRLLELTLADARTRIEAALAAHLPELAADQYEWLPPAESQEVWAAGVTYVQSREARVEEAVEKDFYARAYEAARPELFYKAAGWRLVGEGGLIGIRSDSDWTVPEPELAVLSNSAAEVLGYACGDDMSSRSIEGENPLYLPQAKVYQDSCSVGPAIALAWYVDAHDSTVELTIQRGGAVIYRGESSTAGLARDPAQLVQVLYSSYKLPAGAWLLTGAAVVPPDSYTAMADDVVEIAIAGVGRLNNVAYVVDHSGALAPPRLKITDTPVQ